MNYLTLALFSLLLVTGAEYADDISSMRVAAPTFEPIDCDNLNFVEKTLFNKKCSNQPKESDFEWDLVYVCEGFVKRGEEPNLTESDCRFVNREIFEDSTNQHRHPHMVKTLSDGLVVCPSDVDPIIEGLNVEDEVYLKHNCTFISNKEFSEKRQNGLYWSCEDNNCGWISE